VLSEVRRLGIMSTGRAAHHHDGGLGDALGGSAEIVGEISQPGGELDGHEPRNDLPHDLPEVGSEAFRALNRRRAELIERDIAGQLTGAERRELERLEKTCAAVVDQAFPLPPNDLDALIRLRDRLRAEKEGRGV
jgi:hypothetical protein